MPAIARPTKQETLRTQGRNPPNSPTLSADKVPSSIPSEMGSPLERVSGFDLNRSLAPKPPSGPPPRSSMWTDDNKPLPQKSTSFMEPNNTVRKAPAIVISNRIFNVPLEQVAKLNGVPIVMENAITYLEQKALYEEGLLRLAGNTTDCKQLRMEYDSGNYPNLWNCTDKNTVASLLKQFVRELPRPLIPQTNLMREAPDREDGFEVIQEELSKLPVDNYCAAKRLFHFLHLVANHSEYNKMVPQNLAIVFSPTLRLRMETLVLMVEYAQDMFP